MIRKVMTAWLVCVLLFAFSPFTTHSSEGQTSFQNPYYKAAWDAKGQLRFTDAGGKEILRSVQYVAEYGDIYNLLVPQLPAGTSKIKLDAPPAIPVGSMIQIRSESFAGRLNAPLVHQAKVTSVQGNELAFSPPVSKPIDTNMFIRREHTIVRQYQKTAVLTEQKPDGLLVKVIGDTPAAQVETNYLLRQNSPVVDVEVKTTYKRQIKVFREALTLSFAPKVSEVYRKNRKVDTHSFQKQYWLDREGVRFGQGKQSAFLYHTPHVSSLELNTVQNQLVVNLDHMGDHRYVEETVGKQVGKVRHASEYKPQEQRINTFSLIVGFQPSLMPRLMNQPHGFLATHVWTEHADEQSLASNRAAYYGSEKIASPDKAVGGFVKYKIPVTKSVFYSNPYYRLQQPMNVALHENQEFLQFLKDLHKRGIEIGLHTAYPFDLHLYRDVAENILAFMKNEFHSVTWIDHGYVKYSFGFQGLDIKTPYYIADLWQKYDTRYFWHYSSEDVTNVNQAFDLLQTRNGDSRRTPLYWAHPTVTGPFYSWAAAIVPENTMYRYNEQNLLQLINDRGVFISHAYIARIPQGKAAGKILKRDQKGALVIQPSFDQLLKKMASLRDQQKLYLTTVRDLMKYWLALEQVRMEYDANGTVRVYNDGPAKISGLSMAVRGAEVYVNGKKPPQKKDQGDLIFWFDLEPHAHAVIARSAAASMPKAAGTTTPASTTAPAKTTPAVNR
ncbi:hypothetical protein HN020_00315 [Brevibacillus borstelensis]|uniref:hypothetical protein n=1 Tax=Brevibacillus borstelensis TaxID=45462 RepID=UPI0004691D5A|nr:hypothetical protein [Brevibacillus borstelensis]NOU53269.1 hypothetical protein [Brevibacillus borstelensis]